MARRAKIRREGIETVVCEGVVSVGGLRVDMAAGSGRMEGGCVQA